MMSRLGLHDGILRQQLSQRAAVHLPFIVKAKFAMQMNTLLA